MKNSPIAKSLALMAAIRSEEHTSELQSHSDLVCRLLLEKKKKELRLPPVPEPVSDRQQRWLTIAVLLLVDGPLPRPPGAFVLVGEHEQRIDRLNALPSGT